MDDNSSAVRCFKNSMFASDSAEECLQNVLGKFGLTGRSEAQLIKGFGRDIAVDSPINLLAATHLGTLPGHICVPHLPWQDSSVPALTRRLPLVCVI